MITIRKVLNADASDVLLDTELKVMPYAGTLEVFAASSQNDTNITIFKNDQIVIFNKPVIQSNGGVVDSMSHTPFELEVLEGENVRIDVDIHTAASVSIEASLRAPGE